MNAKKIGVFLLSISLWCCTDKKESEHLPGTLISDVTIVDVEKGTLVQGQNVVIDSGRIQKIISKIDNTKAYDTVISGKGKYLMPGLAEMHAHIPQPPNASEELIDETLFLYLSNGITTIRGMLGHPAHLDLRSKSEAKKILAPRIYTSSPSLNGNTIQTVEEAEAKVTAYKEAGYDFLKIHPGIKKEVFDAAVAKAKALDIPFAGHVPVEVGVRHALESGYVSIDHVDGFLEGLVPESANVNPNENGFFGYNFTPLADSTNIDGLVNLSKEHEVWIVPTQSLYERWFAPTPVDEVLSEPEMQYMAKSTLENWKSVRERYTGDGSFDQAQWQKFNEIRRELIAKLTREGQGVLLGSDAPQVFNVPGFSIHHEIDGMQGAGLSNLEILKSGTINPALFFDALDEFGLVKEGLSADLILLNENPLEDLDALKNLFGVMVKGQWLSKVDIDTRLKTIAEANASK